MDHFIPDTREEKCNTESFADSSECENVDTDHVAAVVETIFAEPSTVFSPQLTRVVKESPHGHRSRYGAQQSDQ